jgi:hypothetical protein
MAIVTWGSPARCLFLGTVFEVMFASLWEAVNVTRLSLAHFVMFEVRSIVVFTYMFPESLSRFVFCLHFSVTSN